MRILIVARGFPTPETPLSAMFERDQAKALAACGHEVIVAVMDLRSARRKRKLGFYHTQKQGLKVYYAALPIGPIPHLMDWVGKWAFARLYKNVCEQVGQPDIVHAHFWWIAGWVAANKERIHCPFVITEHASEINQETIAPALYKRMMRTYPKADACLAVSGALAKRMRKNFGVAVTCVPNIVDTALFKRREKKDVVGREFTFVACGYLVVGKGFDLLLQAFANCLKSRLAIRLVIMGDGPEKQHLKTMAAQLGCADRVEFYGAYCRQEAADMFESADAFVLASKSETFGVVYIEAMAAGLPVIATACGGPEDFVTEQVGILVPVGNVKALTEAMEQMVMQSSSYDRAEIARYAAKNFAPATIAEQLTSIYMRARHEMEKR
ncbi:Glycogen synthase [uncultured Clostridium sp.]|nr:Glycogen synthase [uncultured Clostridium sp.]